MAWDSATLRRIESTPRREVDPRFAELLADVAAGRMTIDDAWTQWQRITAADNAANDPFTP